MKLFDEVKGVVHESAGYTEPSFSYMNRTSREEFARMRDLIEVWFSHYPVSEQEELRSRFRSSSEFHHVGEKDSYITRLVSGGWSIKRIQDEIDKCQVLCASCHRRLTVEERGWYRGMRH